MYKTGDYKFLVDKKKLKIGQLAVNWDILPPKYLIDYDAERPGNWDDREFIFDPNAVKPSDWDKEPEFIVNPNNSKPSDWDNETDGIWRPDLMKNPKWKGKWRP